MIKRLLLFTFLLFTVTFTLLASEPADSTHHKKEKNKDGIKKGWNFGALPILGYNSDIGLQFGALVNLFNYGDGSWYPKYFHQFYAEASWTTKGGGIYQFFYDSEKLLHPVRVTFNATYLTERALDFYGFNGYKAVINKNWTDDQDTLNYLTRVFYRHERKVLRIGVDFTGKFLTEHLKWTAGASYMNFETGPVNVDLLNKGKKEDKKLPDTAGLYDLYCNWNILDQNERNGGMNNYLQLGLIWDNRDNEPNPMHGIWSEVILVFSPSFLGNNHYSFIRLAVTHRQYFTLVKDNLSFAYRLGYLGTIAGRAPFYFLPYMINSYCLTTTIDGLGGSMTVRGIYRNRVVGDGVAFANAEFRWKFWHFRAIKQNWYFALNVFGDAGMVVQEKKIDRSQIPPDIDQSKYFSDTPEYPHVGLGGGLRLAMNQNFIISLDIGQAIDKRDGSLGIYIGLGYIF
ncbi:MAG TPA: BamA/TamA family outer membrane protein [Bacteroidales bacterium]|nr:BamA/TamA family outer membrane protein [Bacteroidales bacterium]